MLKLTISLLLFILCGAVYSDEKISYFAFERPVIRYVNNKYVDSDSAKLTIKRYSRQDPLYYTSFYFNLKVHVSNNVTIAMYFYQFLTNVYKRSFVDIYIKACDLGTHFLVGPVVAKAMKRTLGKVIVCPYPPGVYNLANMTVPTAAIPNFPFQKGRLEMNITWNTKGMAAADSMICTGYADFEIKTMKIKGKN